MNFKNILLISTFFFIGCTQTKTEKNDISDNLKSRLNLIIQEYENFSSNNDRYLNPSVYEVYIEEINNDCFVTIATSYFYKNNIMAAEIIDDNLVAFYNLESKCNTLINVRKEIDSAILKDYTNQDNAFDNYSPAIWSFKIEGDSLILVSQNKFKIKFENASK